MWSVDDILKREDRPPPPPTPQDLPGFTPKRPRTNSRSARYPVMPYPYKPVCYTPPPTPPLTPSPCPPRPKRSPSYAPVTSRTSDSGPLKELQDTAPSPKPRFPPPLQGSLLDSMCRPVVPSSTKNNNSWATGVFKAWVSARNSAPHVSF